MPDSTAHNIAQQIIACFKRGNSLYLCGNGGSYDLANHMEEEFICKFEHDRKPLPALSLKIHSSSANDYGYGHVFTRQVEAYGKPGDILIGISTSGRSLNVNDAMNKALDLGLEVIPFPIKGNKTAEIQEYQLKLMHDICLLVEKAFL